MSTLSILVKRWRCSSFRIVSATARRLGDLRTVEDEAPLEGSEVVGVPKLEVADDFLANAFASFFPAACFIASVRNAF